MRAYTKQWGFLNAPNTRDVAAIEMYEVPIDEWEKNRKERKMIDFRLYDTFNI